MIDTQELKDNVNNIRHILLYVIVTFSTIGNLLILGLFNVLSLHIDVNYLTIMSTFILLSLSFITINKLKKHQELLNIISNFDKLNNSDKVIEAIKIILYINLNLPMYKKHIKGD